MGVAEVADVDCLGAIIGELVRAGAADSIWRVCAWDLISMVLSNGVGEYYVLTSHDYYLVLDSAVDSGVSYA